MYNLLGGENSLLQFFSPLLLLQRLLKGPGNDLTMFINTSCSVSLPPFFSTKDHASVFKLKVQKLPGDL